MKSKTIEAKFTTNISKTKIPHFNLHVRHFAYAVFDCELQQQNDYYALLIHPLDFIHNAQETNFMT